MAHDLVYVDKVFVNITNSVHYVAGSAKDKSDHNKHRLHVDIIELNIYNFDN